MASSLDTLIAIEKKFLNLKRQYTGFFDFVAFSLGK